ncbi:MAG: P1 family peptidase [Calditrichaceae bacterium]|nr:P1 family peptidase [Calditrichaceae bacterium]
MIEKFKIGHYTDRSAGTGCTVIVPPSNNMASACVRGASPGTRELALLAPDKKVSRIDALVLTGGSAFGLGCAHGVMEELAKQNTGYETKYGVVPIVPAAVIFDKNIGYPKAYPTHNNAVQAFKQAKLNNDNMGSIGAGTGATVGKWMGMDSAMKAGIGISSLKRDGVSVSVLTVVNAVGDIIGYDGKIMAGAVNPDGVFFARNDSLSRWQVSQLGMSANTVLSVVMINTKISKQQAYFLAEHAHYGIARRIDPSHTSFDGDVAFVIAIPEIELNIDLISSMVVKCVEESIINSVKYSKSLLGVKSYQEITK